MTIRSAPEALPRAQASPPRGVGPRPPRFAAHLALAALAALALLGPAALPAGAQAGAALVRLAARVTEVGPDARSLSVKAGGATLKVTLAEGAAPAVLDGTRLGDAADGAQLFVLGRKQAAERDPNTQMTVPPQAVQIASIVVVTQDGAFVPPPPTAKQQERRLEWLAGRLKKTPAGFAIDLAGEELNLQWGRERAVIAAAPAAAGALAKGATVLVLGDPAEGRVKGVEEARVAILGKKVPQDQVAALIE